MYALEKFLLQGAVLAAASAPFVSDHSDEIREADRAAIEGPSCDGFNAAVGGTAKWKISAEGLKMKLMRREDDDSDEAEKDDNDEPGMHDSDEPGMHDSDEPGTHDETPEEGGGDGRPRQCLTVTAHTDASHVLGNFPCQICRKNFAKQSSLATHMRTHTRERPFKCKECLMDFREERTLQRHRLVHTGVKRYHCTTCPAMFAQQGNLKRHIANVHTDRDNKPHVCDNCSKGFKQKFNLESHIRAVHAKEKSYQCDLCETAFFVKRSLTRHQARHHGRKDSQCKICGKSFYGSSDLKSHERVHSRTRLKCDNCHKTFASSQGLKKHAAVHTSEKRHAPERDAAPEVM